MHIGSKGSGSRFSLPVKMALTGDASRFSTKYFPTESDLPYQKRGPCEPIPPTIGTGSASLFKSFIGSNNPRLRLGRAVTVASETVRRLAALNFILFLGKRFP